MNKEIEKVRQILDWLDTDEETSSADRQSRLRIAHNALDEIEKQLRGKGSKDLKPRGVSSGSLKGI
jgi:hypothetical protein